MRRSAFLLILVLLACRSEPALIDVRFSTARGPVVIRAEVADTEPERERGLMQRRTLPKDRGMLFTWPDRGERTFYMFRTLIPLDLISIRDGRVSRVSTMEPCTSTDPNACPTTRAGDIDAALEINGGAAARLEITVGTPVRWVVGTEKP